MMKRRFLVFTGLFVVLLLFNTSAFAKSYTVKKGDSLYTIAKQSGMSVDAIKKINHLTKNNLKPGQVLKVSSGKPASGPSTSAKASKPESRQVSYSYKIKKGDTLATISQKTGVPLKHIVALNNVNSRNLHVGRNLILAKASPGPAIISATLDEEDDDLDGEDEDLIPTGPSGDIIGDAKSNEELLGRWGSVDERKLFIKVATGFLGAPYRLGGATVKGIDCSAFVRKMYEFFDISLPRTAREQSAVGLRIDRDHLEEGDLVFFRTKKPIGHVGIYIGNNEFLHASYKSKAVRIDSLEQPYFQKRFQHAVRVKGLGENGGT
jgi:LysM repeat protein